MHNKELYICRVCGLRQLDMPWGESGNDPSHDICDCCGTEFGYEDFTLEAIQNKRELWIKSGAKWWNKKRKPDNWSLEEQLADIPSQFR